MQKIKKTILRERMLEQLGHENVAVFKGLKKELPGVPDEAIQSMTATIMIACDKGCTYVQADFEPGLKEDEAQAKANETPAPNGKTPEQIAQDVKERGGDQASPEQKAKLDRLSKLHGSAPVEFPNEKGKALEEAAKPEPFDKAIKKWVCCPSCNKENITHERTDGSHITYQACFEPNCRVFLNADGTIKPMDRKKGERK